MAVSGALLGCWLLLTVASPRGSLAAPHGRLPARDSSPHLDHGWGGQVRLRHLYAASRDPPAWAAHLRLHDDGSVDGVERQSAHSLLEIKAVARGVVVIRGVKSRRYLCMDPMGRLYGQVSFDEAECTFRESLLADGHNVYRGASHPAVLSLRGAASAPPQRRHRTQQQQQEQQTLTDPLQQNHHHQRHHHQQQEEQQLLPPLSHFLPVVNSLPPEEPPGKPDAGFPWDDDEPWAERRAPHAAAGERGEPGEEERGDGELGDGAAHVDLLDPLGILSQRSRWSWW